MKHFLKSLAAASVVALSMATAALTTEPDATVTFIDVQHASDTPSAMSHAARIQPIAARHGVTLTQVYAVRAVEAGMQQGEWIYMFTAPDHQAMAALLRDPDYIAEGAQDTIHNIVPVQHFVLTPISGSTH